jgi:AcrR family transcriptional regulator
MTSDPRDPADTPETLHALAARYSPTKLRTVDVALDLFAAHGVRGTSLQMIADKLGVTKAAIYHQFPTKDAIVVAVTEVKLLPIEAAVELAEQTGPTLQAREALLHAVIDNVVRDRFTLNTLQADPVLFEVLADHQPSRRLWGRLFSFLLGDDMDAHTRVRAAVLSAAIGASAHPFVLGLDNDVLARDLYENTHRLVFPEA